MVSNAFSSFFRVNSVFYDPSIFGRYQTVTIVLVFAALLFGTVRRPLAAAVAAGLAWIGILTSYSQSAFVALCAAVCDGARADVRPPARVAAAAGALLVGLALLAVPVGAQRRRRPRDLEALAISSATVCACSAPIRSPASGLGGSTEAAREQTPTAAARCAARST